MTIESRKEIKLKPTRTNMDIYLVYGFDQNGDEFLWRAFLKREVAVKEAEKCLETYRVETVFAYTEYN